jgi:hypothetical protein
MFKLLHRLWNGPETASVSSPVFGQMRLVEIRGKQWWESEVEIHSQVIAVSINTQDGALPSDAQVDFFNRALRDIDTLFDLVRPALGATYAEIYGPLPDDWRSVLSFCGIEIPVDGKDENPWSVSFESSDDRKGLYSCSIENREQNHVQFDS